MKNFLYRLKYKIAYFMQGRYGNDELSWTLLIIALILSSVSKRVPGIAGAGMSTLSFVFALWALFRVFSKNITKRYEENRKFKQIFRGPLGTLTILKRKKQDPMHLYLKCPNCKQVLRVPKGKGRIVITCPQCKNKVETNS